MNQELFSFQDDVTHRIDEARRKGLTVVEIIGTFEAIKYKMFQLSFREAEALTKAQQN